MSDFVNPDDLLPSMPDFERDRDLAIDWARATLALPDDKWCLLDLETTGRDPGRCGVVQIAVLAPDGNTLLCARVNPGRPIPPDATRIHGLTDADVQDALTFAALYERLAAALQGRLVVIYNAAYDWRIVTRLCAEHGVVAPDVAGVNCAMLWYAQFHGEWNLRFGNYRWMRLPAAPGVREHDALGDCVSTLRLVERMAAARKGGEVQGGVVATATVSHDVDPQTLVALSKMARLAAEGLAAGMLPLPGDDEGEV